MDELQLSETLQRYFSDVYLCCDEENSGKATLNKTIELIKTGNVTDEIISQISELCWSPSTTTYLNRKQFFSALKLVAAHQANIPIKSDLLTSKLELPLPRFTWTNLEIQPQENATVPDLIELQNDRAYSDNTDSEIDSDTLSIVHNGSPGASSTASDSPTPTNSVQDRSWAVTGAWQGLISEEQRQLLGTEEESSDRHSSEEDTEVSNEVWTITAEQLEYYTNQFKALQPDTKSLIAGPVARMFFEKSRLPVHELRKIWQLADVTKDGALSLQEFNTAMHLVVLRRNHIELPEVLPPTLLSAEAAPVLDTTAKEWTKFVDSPTSSVSSPGPKPVNFDFQKVTLDKDSKILHPVALRLTPEVQAGQVEDQIDSIDLHSPKKFVETSATLQINHSSLNAQNSAIQRPQAKKLNIPGPGAIPPPPNPQTSLDEGPVSLPVFPPPKKEKPPPPPPRPFKTHGRSSSLDLNKLSKLGAPPTVPPRISPNIQTAKKLFIQKSEGDCTLSATTTPGLPTSESETPFANFDEFEKYENIPEGIFPGDEYEAQRKKLFAQFSMPDSANDEVPRKHGAFEIYRKPMCKSRESPVGNEEKAKWELFKQLQDENTVLLRLCQELSQELADIREERLALKVRLEKQINGG